MAMNTPPGVDRIALLAVFMLLFGGWGLYWYCNAAKLDQLMTQDWLAQIMQIENKIPKEKRIAAFRKRAFTMIMLAIALLLWLLADVYQLIKALWE